MFRIYFDLFALRDPLRRILQTKSYIQWGAQHLRIKQYEHLKGFSVTIFALTQKTESDSAVDPLTKCQNCHLRSLLDYLLLQIDQVTLVTNQRLGL